MDEIKPEILADNSEVTINSQQVATLKKHFPQCFDKEGNFIAEKLNEIVSDSGTAFSKESYGLSWLGKSYARLLANENPLTLLAEDKEHNQKPENQDSENLLIKGDNLEVLKHLKGAYSESIKMIYIDPPYNTGSDGFVYQDDRKFTPEQLAELAGIETEEAIRILEFTQSKANSHSAWLTFMYPRLYIARELLKDDGVIFISIDENEVAQLKLLCNEVLGEGNFIGEVVWQKRKGGGNDSQFLAVDHEVVLIYCKFKDKQIGKWRVSYEESYLSRYKESDSKGRFYWDTLHRGGLKSPIIYDVSCPDGSVIKNGTWQISKKSFEEKLKNNQVRIVKSKDDCWSVQHKVYQPEGRVFRSICSDYTNTDSSNELQSLLGESNVFENPKPKGLIQKLCEIVSLKNSEIALDFFAGSGTTAHAVMDLNKADNGNRKFICVQLPEETEKSKAAYKAGYKTIFDITKARIEKAAEKIRAENQDYNGDLGFQIFETLPIFEGYLDNIETLEGDIQDLFDGSTLSDDQLEHLLTTWKVYDGIPLTQSLIETDLAGYTAYRHDRVLYLMHQGFKTESLKAFLSRLDETDGDDKNFDVEKVVLFGYNFDSKNQLEINEAVRQYKNRKEKTVSVVVRY